MTEVRRSASSDHRSYLLTSVDAQNRDINTVQYSEAKKLTAAPIHAGTTYEFTDIHVTGYAGLAIVEIFQEGKHIYTDYISLYKFDDGWKLVTKIFYSHPQD